MKHILFWLVFFSIFPTKAQTPPHSVKVIMDDFQDRQSIRIFLDLFSLNDTQFNVSLNVIKTSDLNSNSKFEPEETKSVMMLDSVMSNGEHVIDIDLIDNSYTGIEYSATLTINSHRYHDQLHLQNIEKDHFWNKLLSNSSLSRLMKIVTLPLMDASNTTVFGVYDLENDSVIKIQNFKDLDIMNATMSSDRSIIMEVLSDGKSRIAMFEFDSDSLSSLFSGKSPIWIPTQRDQFLFINKKNLFLWGKGTDSATNLALETDRLIRAQIQDENIWVVHQKKDSTSLNSTEYYLTEIDSESYKVKSNDRLVSFSFIKNLQFASVNGSDVLSVQNDSIGVYKMNDENQPYTKFNLSQEYLYTGASWSADAKYVLFFGERK